LVFLCFYIEIYASEAMSMVGSLHPCSLSVEIVQCSGRTQYNDWLKHYFSTLDCRILLSNQAFAHVVQADPSPAQIEENCLESLIKGLVVHFHYRIISFLCTRSHCWLQGALQAVIWAHSCFSRCLLAVSFGAANIHQKVEEANRVLNFALTWRKLRD
jgi:hypothetical protein